MQKYCRHEWRSSCRESSPHNTSCRVAEQVCTCELVLPAFAWLKQGLALQHCTLAGKEYGNDALDQYSDGSGWACWVCGIGLPAANEDGMQRWRNKILGVHWHGPSKSGRVSGFRAVCAASVAQKS